MAERVDDGQPFQVGQHHVQRRLVGVGVVNGRLVRHMKIGSLQNPFGPQLVQQRGQKRIQKALVAALAHRRVPAKNGLLAALHLRHHLGRVFCAPLGEQVRHLKIFESHRPAKAYPAPEPRVIKAVFPAPLFHPHQLGGGALGADQGVQRRGEQRCQDHVYPPLRRQAQKMFHNGPMPLAEHLAPILLRQAVRVEPLGVQQPLGRQGGGHHVQGKPRPGQLGAARGGEYQLHPPVTAGGVLRDLAVHPQGTPLLPYQLHSFFQRGQQVRVKPRLFANVLRVVLFFAGEGHRHAFHPPQPHLALKIPLHPHPGKGVAGGLLGGLVHIVVPVEAVGGLKRHPLPPKAGQPAQRPGVQHAAFGQHLFQRADHAHVIFHTNAPFSP